MRILETENFDIQALLNKSASVERWIPLLFGKHEGLTIPEIIFIDPGWFYWALFVKAFRGSYEYQAMIAAYRMSHMLPPRENPSDWLFLIRLKNGLFQDFSIVEKSKVKKSINSDLIRSNHLDLSIVSKLNWATNWSRRMMVSRILTEFFDKDAERLRRKDFIGFLDSDRNFDLNCGRKHCAGIERWNSPGAALEDKVEVRNRFSGISDAALQRIQFAQFSKALLNHEY